MNISKLAFLFLIFIVCNSSNTPNPINYISKKDVTVMFIGNSLTYTNNLPKLVKAIAKQKGISMKTKMIAFPNYALMDHWKDGEIQKELTRIHYDFVIIRQGPSSQAFGKEILLKYGKKLSDLCKINQAKLCYFMVWPSLTNYYTFDNVIKNYREASISNEAILCPVGEIWKNHFDHTGNFDYYASDGFHPSQKGSLNAAKTIVECLFGK